MSERELRGALSEQRFLTACNIRTLDTPRWFVGVEEADLEMDIRGIDALAEVYPWNGIIPVKIPVQIKSSAAGKRKFRNTMSKDKVKHIAVVVVRDNRTDHQLRRQLYTELAPLRKLNLDFDGFFDRLRKDYMPPALVEKVSKLAAENRRLRAETG